MSRVKFTKLLVFVGILSLLFQLGSPLAVDATVPIDPPLTFTHTNSVGNGEACEREITGSINFTMPETQKKFDFVIVQDASGSFANTIGDMRTGLKQVVNNLAATYGAQNNRVMLVTYRGGDKLQWYKMENGVQKKGDSSTQSSWPALSVGTRYSLSNNFTTGSSNVLKAINDFSIGGATPTAAGLQHALLQYQAQMGTPDSNRETIFLLVTDGVANVRLDEYIWVDRNWGGSSHYSFSERYQDYKTAINQALAQAEAITNAGYHLITAYLEDTSLLAASNSYGSDYYNGTVGPDARSALNAMATDGYYVLFDNPTSFGTTIANKIGQMIYGLSEYSLRVDLLPGYEVVSAALYKGSEKVSDLNWSAGQNPIAGSTLAGDYRIEYTMREQGFYADDRIPVAAVVLSAGTALTYGNNPTVPGNTHTDCELEPTVPEKKVNGEDAHTLGNLSEVVTFTVSTKVCNIYGLGSFAFEDQVDNLLEIVPNSVIITALPKGGTVATDITSAFTVSTVGKKVVATYNATDGFAQLLKNKVVLTFQAKVAAGVTLQDILTKYTNNKIPNEAQLLYSYNSETDPTTKDSNTVTITPPTGNEPPEEPDLIAPTIEKTVNNGQHLDLINWDDLFVYHVIVEIPDNVEGYESLVIEDDLDTILAYDSSIVLVDGTQVTLGSHVSSGQNVRLTISDGFADLAGKTITLVVNAKLSSSDVSGYPDGKVPNKGTFSLNGQTAVESNEVTVTPPTGDEPPVEPEDPTPPSINKNVNGEEHQNLETRNEVFTYNILVEFPEDVAGYESVVIQDTLEGVLEIVGTPQVTVGGVAHPGLAGLVNVTGQTVSLAIANSYATPVGFSAIASALPPNIFDELADKVLILSISARIRDDADLTGYADEVGVVAIPNVATLDSNVGELESNTVTITPPTGDEPPVEPEDPTPPTIGKNVNGKTHENLGSWSQVFTYNITVPLPDYLTEYNSLVVEDVLEGVLQVVGDPQVRINGTLDAGLTDLVDVDGQRVSLTLESGAVPVGFSTIAAATPTYTFGELAGKTLTLSFDAKIRAGASLSAYTNRTVPNMATLTLDDEWGYESALVTVRPPAPPIEDDPYVPEDPIVPRIIKNVNGEQHWVLDEAGEEFEYNMQVAIPSNISGYSKLTITDVLEPVLVPKAVKVLVNNVEDALLTGKATINGQTIKLEITEGFGSLAGKTITLQVTAALQEEADLSNYLDGIVPNKAGLSLNDEFRRESDVVTVTLVEELPDDEIPEGKPEVPTEPEEEFPDEEIPGDAPEIPSAGGFVDTAVMLWTGAALIVLGALITFRKRSRNEI